MKYLHFWRAANIGGKTALLFYKLYYINIKLHFVMSYTKRSHRLPSANQHHAKYAETA